MVTDTISSQQLEQTAKKMRRVVKSAQRTLLEFEVLMSVSQIENGQSEKFETVDQLLNDSN